MQGGIPSAKFPAVGAIVKGKIIASEVAQQRDVDTGQPKTWSDGNPMLQLVITLETDETDPNMDDDTGHRKLYAKGGGDKAMLGVIRAAIKAAGSTKIENCATLTVKYIGDGERKKAAFDPPKQYAAKYEPPPAAGVNV